MIKQLTESNCSFSEIDEKDKEILLKDGFITDYMQKINLDLHHKQEKAPYSFKDLSGQITSKFIEIDPQ